ncbi:hypothetical protein PMAYCL1PPCAC_27255, partial [Pristionchus mayeri]
SMRERAEDAISLSNLPLDVIRVIVPMIERRNKLRLISPSWNFVVLERGMSIPAESIRIVYGYNDELTFTYDISKLFRRYFPPHSVKDCTSLRNKFTIQTVHYNALKESMKPSFLKCFDRVKSLRIENVEAVSFNLIRYCFESVQVDRVTIIVKKGAADWELRHINNLSAAISSRFEVHRQSLFHEPPFDFIPPSIQKIGAGLLLCAAVAAAAVGLVVAINRCARYFSVPNVPPPIEIQDPEPVPKYNALRLRKLPSGKYLDS